MITAKNNKWFNHYFILMTTLIAIPMSGIATDIYSPSMPHIAAYFGVSRHLVQITMTTFMLGFALGQIPFGVFSDVAGRKRPLILAVFLYMGVSLAAPFSENIYWLIGLRFIQGFSVAGPSSITKSILKDNYDGLDLKRNLTLLSTAWGLGPILAPWIGGYLQHYYGWQANFFFMLGYGTLVMIIVLFLFRETHHAAKRVSFHFPTVTSHFILLLKNVRYVVAVFMMGVSYAFILSFNVIGPFLIQNQLGYGARVFGHMALLAGLSFFMGTIINRFFIKKYETKVILRAGAIAFLIITLAMVLDAFLFKMSLVTIMIPVCAMMFMVGVQYTGAMISGMSHAGPTAGVAASLMGFLNMLTVAIVTALAVFVNTHNLVSYAFFCLGLAGVMVLLYLACTVKNSIRTQAPAPRE